MLSLRNRAFENIIFFKLLILLGILFTYLQLMLEWVPFCIHFSSHSMSRSTKEKVSPTGWVICSGTANRGCCEAVYEVTVISFTFYQNLMFFKKEKHIFAQFFQPRPLKWPQTSFYHYPYLPTPFSGCPIQLAGFQCNLKAAWRHSHWKMKFLIPLKRS